MKVYIGPYKNWVGPYQLANLLRFLGVSEETRDRLGDWLSETFVSDICQWIHDHNHRKVKIKIHDYDLWSMDITLAMIILPMLRKFKEDNTYSYFSVDNSDVPENLRSPGESYDEFMEHELAEPRCRWVVDEMIWTFEQLHPDTDWEDQYHIGGFDKEGYIKHQDKINNGLRLFGKYYQALWI